MCNYSILPKASYCPNCGCLTLDDGTETFNFSTSDLKEMDVIKKPCSIECRTEILVKKIDKVVSQIDSDIQENNQIIRKAELLKVKMYLNS